MIERRSIISAETDRNTVVVLIEMGVGGRQAILLKGGRLVVPDAMSARIARIAYLAQIRRCDRPWGQRRIRH
jgi:hypothetical protein